MAHPSSLAAMECMKQVHLSDATLQELADLGTASLSDAVRYVDGGTSDGWVTTSTDGGLTLAQKQMSGAKLPLYRGRLKLSADEAPALVDVASVIASHVGRQFFDQSYERSVLLAPCGQGSSLICDALRSSVVLSPAVWLHLRSIRRSNANLRPEVAERITMVATEVPQEVVASCSQAVAAFCNGETLKDSGTKFWVYDAIAYVDGSLQVSYLLLTNGNSLKIPGFLAKKGMATLPGLPLRNICRMASSGLLPRHVIALTGPVAEDAEEVNVQDMRLMVSKRLQHILLPGSP
eukprot:TRINITY_DN83344_c0_g1_i1.p1 TRINITY_DN83344_c0_g1~~TRINITY_DN83344_c0_g1_i1.p1  ORF type:complete len:292 (+),score=47.89 TRINITY_DN83344_c0_g1_i1:144-1019(+)